MADTRSMLFSHEDDDGYLVQVTGDDTTGDAQITVYAPGKFTSNRVVDVPRDQVNAVVLALAAHLHRTAEDVT